MKRLAFATPEQLAEYCSGEHVTLIVEFTDEEGRQQQVTFQEDTLSLAGEFLQKKNAMAYFRKEKLFYEIVAEWLKEH